ncbi:hypothetical protein Pse7367_1046 [Thalassoporum mexicanum PCC 7367]|uniref:hypothetical protein n=1 Tax=Thalassoporum mexicanum TaxID=3457544 RepID=UPI00029FCE6D|nr:hypothetical protein [Pseudanabaena sp. PCC 7367]AFY69344.1 hypothetical protein Pse7367_1046 [Pseudanabaena sp. PCC 7367]
MKFALALIATLPSPPFILLSQGYSLAAKQNYPNPAGLCSLYSPTFIKFNFKFKLKLKIQ